MYVEPGLLSHSLDALEALLKTKDPDEPEDKPCVLELEGALQYIREDFDSTGPPWQKLLPNKRITNPGLWALFSTNTIVYSTDQRRNRRAWRVRSAEERKDRKGNQWLQLEPEHVGYDCTNVGR